MLKESSDFYLQTAALKYDPVFNGELGREKMDASLVKYVQQLIKQNPSAVPDDVREAVESANRGGSVP